MKGITIISSLLCTFAFYNNKVTTANLPGPMVYVVTPSTRLSQNDEARSAPFYYHNWVRRMDLGLNTTTAVPTTTLKKKETPDLIFAEFESDSNGNMKKSIRKLLERERVGVKTSSTLQPIYVPDKNLEAVTEKPNYGLPSTVKFIDQDKKPDYFAMYNQLYNNAPAPIYLPTSTPSTTTTKLTTTVLTDLQPNNVDNIWHIIDSEKSKQFQDNWEEVPVESNREKVVSSASKLSPGEQIVPSNGNGDENLYNSYEVSGFDPNPGNGAENESRAIRTESNIGFPYVNLKPFQVKSMQKPVQNYLSHSKKNNLFTNLDNFYDLKNPVRGEAQDVNVNDQAIDRYNPAQPYLPQSYGGHSKQSNSAPVRATANLVPPPPPSPKLTDTDFPIPTNYESFPPYPPSISDSIPSPPPMSNPSISVYSPPGPPRTPSPTNLPSPSDNSGYDLNFGHENGDVPPMDLGYRYKPPPPSKQLFLPTISPIVNPLKGYSYNKPPVATEEPSIIDMNDKPASQGYNYDKPDSISPPSDNVPSLSYSSHDSLNHNSDYPELSFPINHGDDSKHSDLNDVIDMMPPPPADMKPDLHAPHIDDSGFPSDLPEDFKYHHDFDDHDFYHHPHHHTTTTTTEMPRVNRFSYYYLGKKLYYLPLYFSVYFIVYVGALIIKAVLRHKIVYPNSWRPNTTTAGFFSKRSIESWDLSNENLHEVTGKVTHAIATAAKLYLKSKEKNS